MEKIKVRPVREIYALSEAQIYKLANRTDGEIFYNKKQVLIYFLRYILSLRYTEEEFKDSDQLFVLRYMNPKDKTNSEIKIKGLSILNFININAIHRDISINIPINIEREISMQRNSSYTVCNEKGKEFEHLFTRFQSLSKWIKSRLIDRFEYSSNVDYITDMRFEVLMIIFLYLDFVSLSRILRSWDKFHTNFWKNNNEFWYNIYKLRFGKTPFSSSTGNWAKIYRNKLNEKK